MKKKWFVVFLAITLLLTGCSTNKNGAGTESKGENNNSEATPIVVEDVFSNRDFKTDYEENCAYIQLTGTSATCASNAVEIKDGVITIKDEGTYVISGSLENGMIVVAAEDTDKTQIVLNGVSIHNDTSAVIYIKQADKVFITLENGSENTLSSGDSFQNDGEEEIDGVIYSKSDLTLNGKGSLSVKSPAGHGIVSKDDLLITGGTYTVDAATHGLSANDMLGIADGQFTIVSGEDSVHCDVNVYIEAGTFEINAKDDAFHADEKLLVCGGKIDVTNSYEGFEALHIEVAGGDIRMVCTDDGLNAAGGTDSSGFGETGNDQFGGPGGKPGGQGGRPDGQGGRPGGHGGMGSGSSDGSIVISGGTLYIKASGDGIDANGTLEISGGMITVCGPSQGDTATLDYDVSGVITGGTFIGTGGQMMAQSFSSSEQGVVAVKVGSQEAGTLITLIDSSGNVMISYEPELPYAIVILSSPDIKKGETYTITVGEASGQFEAQ